MGEYADDAIFANIDEYWGDSRGYNEPKTLRKEPKTCNRCGYGPLYWWQADGRWLLHHYVDDDMIMHHCGFDHDGLPSGSFPYPKSYDGVERPPKVAQRKPRRALFPDTPRTNKDP